MKKIIVTLLISLFVLSFLNITSFANDVPFTRGSFCAKIVELLEIECDISNLSNPFFDVNTNDEHYDDIMKMYLLGYMVDDDGQFSPSKRMTTGQVAMIITKMIFGDFSVPDNVELGNAWYAKYAWKAKETGLMPDVLDWEIYACESDIDVEKIKEYVPLSENYKIATIERISEVLNSDGLVTLLITATMDDATIQSCLASTLVINRKAYKGVDISNDDIVALKAMLPLDSQIKIKFNSKNEVERIATSWNGVSVKKPTQTVQIDNSTYYIINSCEELVYIAHARGEWLDKNYIQAADLHLNDCVPVWNESGVCTNADELYNWTPIGNDTRPFTGKFLGNGYSIERLYSSGETLSNRGLFGVIEGGNIDGLNIKDSYVSNTNTNGLSMSGVLAGSIISKGSIQNRISNCIVEHSCIQGYRAGGYAGSIGGYYLYLPMVENCYASISVHGLSGENSYVGGFFGTANCQAYNCFVTGKVSGYGMLGGFTGWNETMNTSFTNCLSTCEVSSKNNQNFLKTGGFIGDNTWATTTNCFWLQTDDINCEYHESDGYGYAIAEDGLLLTSKEIFSDDNAKNILNNWIQENNTEYAEWIDRLDVVFMSKPYTNVMINDHKVRISSLSAQKIKNQILISVTLNNVPNDACVFIASYDVNNQMLHVKNIDLVNGTSYIEVPLEKVKTLKAFVWENLRTINPLCASKEYTLQ